MCLFLVVFPFFVSPDEVLVGLLMILSGFPVYFLFVYWQSKPKCLVEPWGKHFFIPSQWTIYNDRLCCRKRMYFSKNLSNLYQVLFQCDSRIPYRSSYGAFLGKVKPRMSKGKSYSEASTGDQRETRGSRVVIAISSVEHKFPPPRASRVSARFRCYDSGTTYYDIAQISMSYRYSISFMMRGNRTMHSRWKWEGRVGCRRSSRWSPMIASNFTCCHQSHSLPFSTSVSLSISFPC